MSSFILNVTFDCGDPQRLAAFWAQVLDYDVEMDSPEVVRLINRDKRGVRRLIFWRVPEPKVGKTRIHVDLASRTPEQEVQRLVELGASVRERLPEWTVMADPEGNEFCVA